ncbi:MAG TPA: M15 family metallopeptidase [Thermoleophilaceae bacterium]|nr:M15 family metallopeptidase [Thermoleophilaceae bacterium]
MRRTILSAFVVLLTAMAGPAAAAELPGSFTLREYAGAGPATSRTAGPRVFPARSRLRAVRDYLRGRAGIESWALIDSRGREHGWAPHRTYVSASLVKAMLLVARLRAIAPARPSAADRALLGPMITESDNDRADAVYALVGDAALYDLGRRAHMRDFSVAGYWSGARFSALDQARFFRRIDRMVPPRSRAYARGLLSSIVPWQRWGFSRYARAGGFTTFMKGGWRSTALGRLVHEAALFERGSTRLSMAVLTDGNPSHEYGTATLRGVAQRVFREPARARRARRAAQRDGEAGTPAHRRAGLADVHRFAPDIAVELVYRTTRNLTGRRLPGYCADWALLYEPAARSLGRVQRYLRRRGLGLLILDAYRPARATRALVRWAMRSGNEELVGTYIARRSRHNTGSAVDLTLVRTSDGERLPMGRYDALGPGAHTRSATGRVLRNRLTLESAMERFGFENYWREWWHFEHAVRPARYLDLTLGC